MPRYRHAGDSIAIDTTREEIEDQTAHRFERVLEDEGVSLGEGCRRDGIGLRVDFVYDDAQPPVALEVTRIVDTKHQQVSTFLTRMGETLNTLAEAENLGFWSIVLKEGWKDKALGPAIAQFLRARRFDAPPLTLAAPASNLDAAPLPDAPVQLGLVAAAKHDGKHGIHVWPQVSDGAPGVSGFSDRLVWCVADNEAKLGEARPRETHLAILVEDSQFVADPKLSLPPALEDTVDVLWVFLSDFLQPRNGHRIWRARRGMTQWELFWPRAG